MPKRSRSKKTPQEPTPRKRPAPPPMGNWSPPEIQREQDDEVLFGDFELDNRILRAICDDLEFRACTPIQGLALPHALAGKDLAARAQTGTGKTAAFLITILQRFLTQPSKREPHQPMALVIAPTRELAVQINRDAEDLGPYAGIHSLAVYGGMDYDKQREELGSGIDLVVATPGRLIDYLRQKVVDLSRVEVLILDEADRMLDMGFIPDVKRIMGRLPAPSRRQTMLFSATLSPEILNLASRWMREDTVTVEADPDEVVAEGVEEVIYAVPQRDKLAVLLWLLKNDNCERVLIFRNRRRGVEDLHDELVRYGIPCAMLSGDVKQTKRLRILDGFRKGDLPIIVATDVAGRGIHVDGITHVVNYEMPYDAEDYVHRIGRTGRAGKKGRAISLAGEDCSFVIPEIEEYIDRELPIAHPDENMLVLPEPRHPKRPRKPPGGSSARRSRRPRGRGRPRR